MFFIGYIEIQLLHSDKVARRNRDPFTGTQTKGATLGTDKECLGKRAQGDVYPCRKQEAASRVSALAFYSLAGLSLQGTG